MASTPPRPTRRSASGSSKTLLRSPQPALLRSPLPVSPVTPPVVASHAPRQPRPEDHALLKTEVVPSPADGRGFDEGAFDRLVERELASQKLHEERRVLEQMLQEGAESERERRRAGRVRTEPKLPPEPRHEPEPEPQPQPQPEPEPEPEPEPSATQPQPPSPRAASRCLPRAARARGRAHQASW